MPSNKKNIAVLLASYNGELFLEQQLNSYKDQSYKNWSLYVSDDGSSDRTLSIVSRFFAKEACEGFYSNGPQKGFAENFISMIDNPVIEADYYALSDQDDIWCNDKLERAEAWLSEIGESRPALFCSRTQLIDENNLSIGYSPLYKKKPGFANALLQNIASGNTMVFNNKARDLLRRIESLTLIAHDWSLYQLVTGCGGAVYYDESPTVLYRQHRHNVIGNGMNILNRCRNFIAAHYGRNAVWYETNKKALLQMEDYLTSESKQILFDFSEIRNKTLLNRVRLLRRSGVYHQRWIGTMATLTYVLCNHL